MSVLTGPQIAQCIQGGWIKVDPYNSQHINPNSIDLTLGDQFRVYTPNGDVTCPYPFLDTKKENKSKLARIPQEGLIITRGRVYLMHTQETVHTDHYVSCVDGKSSLGRLGLLVHVTAGYVDTGYHGQITLELAVVGESVRIYTGMRIAQLRFMSLCGDPMSYQDRGNYTGEASQGPVASRSWKQFE